MSDYTQDKHAHRRLKPLLGWSLILVLAAAGAVRVLVVGCAGLWLAEAMVPPPANSSAVMQSLMLLFHIAICCALIGGAIGFALTFVMAKRLLDDRVTLTAARIAPAILPLLVVVLALAGIGVRWYRISCDLDAELAKIKAAGEPTCAADLSWYRPVSPAELGNGDAFLKAFALLNREFDTQCPIMLHCPPSDQQTWQEIEKAGPLLQRNEQCLKLLHRLPHGPAGHDIRSSQTPYRPFRFQTRTAASTPRQDSWRWKPAFGSPTATGAVRGSRFRRSSCSQVLSITNRTFCRMVRESFVKDLHRKRSSACCPVAT